MAFNLKSGNKPQFKMMGCSSPMKQTTDPKKAKKTSEDYINEGFSPREALQMERDGAVTGTEYQDKKVTKTDSKKTEMKPPKLSTTSAHGQLEDAAAEYETDKKLYDEYMKDKARKEAAKKNKAGKKGEDRPDPTYEGTDEYRKEEDIPKEEFEKRGLKKPKKSKPSPGKNYKNPQDYKVFNMGNKPSPVKQTTDPKNKKAKKTYPKSYTKKDIEFLKKQREDVVRREDFEKGSKERKMFDRNQAQLKAKEAAKKKKKK